MCARYADAMSTRSGVGIKDGGVPSRTYETVVMTDPGSTMTALEVPFDPKPVFGKVRAPVRVTVGTHTFRSTIAAMGGPCFVPLRRSNREAAGVAGGQRVRVTLTLDTEPRVVAMPTDLRAALRRAGAAALAAWKSMAYTHQREHAEAIEGAKKPETRRRRIEQCVAAMRERAERSATKREAHAGRARATRPVAPGAPTRAKPRLPARSKASGSARASPPRRAARPSS